MEILKIIREFVPDAGICSFERIQEHLLPCRAKSRLPEHPKSVILMIFPYRFPDSPGRNLSRYACVPDYHTVAGEVLNAAAKRCEKSFPGYQFIPFMDNSPIPEVKAAALSGLGVIGQNGLLIHPKFGSFLFLGELVTDLPLTPTGDTVRHCYGCGNCVTACPGSCLPGGERETCVSAISQKKGMLTETETALLKKGGLIWGCDRCQEACPLNRDAVIDPHPCFTDYTPQFDPDHPDFDSRAYAWRGKAVPGRNAELLKKK